MQATMLNIQAWTKNNNKHQNNHPHSPPHRTHTLLTTPKENYIHKKSIRKIYEKHYYNQARKEDNTHNPLDQHLQ